VSPWSNDSQGADINVGIGTREIALGPRTPPRWMSWRKPGTVAEPRSVPMPLAQCFTESGALYALRAALGNNEDDEAQEAPRAPLAIRSAHIVLDDFWGNHAILRGDFRTLRAREIDEIARAHFVDTYGVNGEALVVRACVQQGGHALFASALPHTLVGGIRETGTAAGVRIEALKLCLPEMLNRTIEKMPQPNAMLVFAADSLMQTVLIEAGRWVGYDAQRLFAGDTADAAQVAALVEQAFERCAERTALTRETCALGLYGFDADPALPGACFASVTPLAAPANEGAAQPGDGFAQRLLEYAQ
jgi:hypothetical protein